MEQRKLNRRDFLQMATLAAAGTLVSQCAPAATPEVIEKQVTVEVEKIVKETVVVEKAVTPETVTVEWWPGWPYPAMVAIAKLFQDQHPGVNIKAVTTYPDMAGTLAAIASGTPPDIISDVPYLELIVRGVCLPLDDYIAGSSVVSLTDGDIRKEHWEVFAWEGKHYGVPAVDTAGREGMGYNLDLIEKAGLTLENPPQTWDEVFEWHKKITTYDAAGNLDVLGMNPFAERLEATSYGDPWVLPQIWGFHYYNADEQKYEIDRPETVDFLNMIKKFFDDVGAEKMNGLTQALSGIERDAFGVGKAAMRITYPSAAGSMWRVLQVQTSLLNQVEVVAHSFPTGRVNRRYTIMLAFPGKNLPMLLTDIPIGERNYLASSNIVVQGYTDAPDNQFQVRHIGNNIGRRTGSNSRQGAGHVRIGRNRFDINTRMLVLEELGDGDHSRVGPARPPLNGHRLLRHRLLYDHGLLDDFLDLDRDLFFNHLRCRRRGALRCQRTRRSQGGHLQNITTIEFPLLHCCSSLKKNY